MPPATTAQIDLPAALRGLESALAAGRADDAEAALQPLLDHPSLPPAALDPTVRQLAQHWLGQRQWGRAAEGFDRLQTPQPGDTMQGNFARNLAAFQTSQPREYAILLRPRPAEPTPRYRVVAGQNGRTLLAQRTTPADAQPPQFTVVAPGEQWPAFLEQARRSTDGKPDQPLALLSIGDGYALSHLADHPPDLFMDQALPVHVIEPDLDRVLLALHVHDWSQPTGPIRDRRFCWHLGPDWEQHFVNTWRNDPWMPQPALAVCPDPDQGGALRQPLQRLTDRFQEQLATELGQAKRRYARGRREDLVALLGDAPPRKPRLLLMTSRFTTVLQYATADTAAGFEQLGWETRTLIETDPHERFNMAVFAQALRDFEPDVLLSIDATRHRLNGWVPDELPYICWIQDALPRLMNDTLGRSIGQRDYVLSFFTPRLVGDHAYPARQCIDMPMMVTADQTPCPVRATDEHTGPDLIYASNVSATPGGLLQASLDRAHESLHPLVEAAGEAVLAHYEGGEALPTEPDIDALLERLVDESVLPGHDAAARRALLDALWNPLNTGLYRQQALGWVADTAEELGLTLHVHGNGWEANPRFAALARGPLDHGTLKTATAEAGFALHLEPYICFSHHRMLDATLAGTPVLVRDHPGNRGLQTVAAFLAEHAPQAESDAEARSVLQGDAGLTMKLDELLQRHRVLTWDLAGDVVAQVRCWQNAGVLPDTTGLAPALPGLDAITFRDAASFRERLDALIGQPRRVAEIVTAQQSAIRDRLTFPAAFRRAMARVRDLIADETPPGMSS